MKTKEHIVGLTGVYSSTVGEEDGLAKVIENYYSMPSFLPGCV
jgi:hypothetical protein